MHGYLSVKIFPQKLDYTWPFVEPSEWISLLRSKYLKEISLCGLIESDVCLNVTIRYDQTKSGTHSMNIHARKTLKITDCTRVHFFKGIK